MPQNVWLVDDLMMTKSRRRWRQLPLRLFEHLMEMPGSNRALTGRCTPPVRWEHLFSSKWKKQQVQSVCLQLKIEYLLTSFYHMFCRGLSWPTCKECSGYCTRLLQRLTKTGTVWSSLSATYLIWSCTIALLTAGNQGCRSDCWLECVESDQWANSSRSGLRSGKGKWQDVS